jgi:GT2 family glycosyltransferase
MIPRVLVSLVTFNSAAFLRRCIDSLRRQTYLEMRVCLWDNASGDETAGIVAENAGFLHTSHFSRSNIGFCSAHNRVIAGNEAEYVLVLNPDVVLDPRFVETLVGAMENDPSAGSATGKLRRLGQDEKLEGSDLIIDTTGVYMTPSQRHFDRGSGEPDRGQYERREYVFGASGAAAFYRRAMLDSASASGEYFDPAFFAYREDADLAWRAQWLGWRCLYVPEALGYHARLVLPERRRILPADINMHSFKNRFLMRAKNMDPGTYLRFFFPITARDIGAIAYVLLRERSSLRALPLLARELPQAWSMRRALCRHRRRRPAEVRSWFAWRPVAKPVPPP